MKFEKLQRLLGAKRSDLIDGFPATAALKALTSESAEGSSFKVAYLNDLLEPRGIEIKLKRNAPAASYFSEHGIVSAEIDSAGFIDVVVSERFFSNEKTPLQQALRLQSIVLHELVHRDLLTKTDDYVPPTDVLVPMRSDEELSDTAYINDPHELEAMAAEVIHDLAAREVLTEGDMMAGSPRLAFITQHAGQMSTEAITFFQRKMSEGKLETQ